MQSVSQKLAVGELHNWGGRNVGNNVKGAVPKTNGKPVAYANLAYTGF